MKFGHLLFIVYCMCSIVFFFYTLDIVNDTYEGWNCFKILNILTKTKHRPYFEQRRFVPAWNSFDYSRFRESSYLTKTKYNLAVPEVWSPYCLCCPSDLGWSGLQSLGWFEPGDIRLHSHSQWRKWSSAKTTDPVATLNVKY